MLSAIEYMFTVCLLNWEPTFREILRKIMICIYVTCIQCMLSSISTDIIRKAVPAGKKRCWNYSFTKSNFEKLAWFWGTFYSQESIHPGLKKVFYFKNCYFSKGI